jgi:hypothetical protein
MLNDSSGDLVLTYRELGERLGIEPDSARARARRRGWRVVLDNHGIARVHVPPSELPDEPPERGVRTGNGADAEGYVQGTLAELSTHLARALDEVREERARVEAVQEREVEARIALARTDPRRRNLGSQTRRRLVYATVRFMSMIWTVGFTNIGAVRILMT